MAERGIAACGKRRRKAAYKYLWRKPVRRKDMEKKYLFFDIDGTLTDRATGEIVPSAKEVLQRLEENGHFVAIATGRAHYKAENFTLSMAGVLSWMVQKMFI